MQESPQNVLKYEGAEIPDVRVRVDRGAARVNAYFSCMERFEGLNAVRQRVVEHYRLHF
jgi:hypothetical protein